MNFCPNCGTAKSRPDEAFCQKCGYVFPAQDPAPQPAQQDLLHLIDHAQTGVQSPAQAVPQPAGQDRQPAAATPVTVPPSAPFVGPGPDTTPRTAQPAPAPETTSAPHWTAVPPAGAAPTGHPAAAPVQQKATPATNPGGEAPFGAILPDDSAPVAAQQRPAPHAGAAAQPAMPGQPEPQAADLFVQPATTGQGQPIPKPDLFASAEAPSLFEEAPPAPAQDLFADATPLAEQDLFAGAGTAGFDLFADAQPLQPQAEPFGAAQSASLPPAAQGQQPPAAQPSRPAQQLPAQEWPPTPSAQQPPAQAAPPATQAPRQPHAAAPAPVRPQQEAAAQPPANRPAPAPGTNQAPATAPVAATPAPAAAPQAQPQRAATRPAADGALTASQIQQNLFASEENAPTEPAYTPPARAASAARSAPPTQEAPRQSPPPITLPETEPPQPGRRIARLFINLLIFILVLTLAVGGATLVMLYMQNRSASVVDNFLQAVEDKSLGSLQTMVNQGKLELDGVEPTQAGWDAFFEAFATLPERNALKSQLLLLAEDPTTDGQPYPAVTIKSSDLVTDLLGLDLEIPFIKQHRIIISGVTALAETATAGTKLQLNGEEYLGVPQDPGVLYLGIMPGLYDCKLLLPGIDVSGIEPSKVSLFGVDGPNVLELDQISATVRVYNCLSDDAILFINNQAVQNQPEGGVVTLEHVSLGSIIRIQAMQDGTKMESSVVFDDPTITDLSFGDYVVAPETPPDDSSSDSTSQEGAPPLSESEVNAVLAAFYGSYLESINNQSIDNLRFATDSCKTAMTERISRDGNKTNNFEYVGATCAPQSFKTYESGGRQALAFNASFSFKYRPRNTQDEWKNSSNKQSVELVYENGQWVVNHMVFVSDGDYNNNVLAAFE